MQKKEEYLKQRGVSFVSQHCRARADYMRWRKGFSGVLKKVDSGKIERQESVDLLVRQFEMLMSFVGTCSGLIFSDENVLGWPLGHYYGRYQVAQRVDSFYPSLNVILEAFESVLSREFDCVNFYVVKRNWNEQLKSLYKDFFAKYLHEDCITLKAFSSSIESCGSRRSFDRFWEEFAVFPCARVIPYSSSWGEVLLEYLQGGLGVHLVQFSGEMSRSNASLDDELIEKLIGLYPFLREGRSRYSSKEFKFLKKLLS